MVANAHGHQVLLRELRARFGTSLRGANVEQLVNDAAALGLGGRALRLEMDELTQLQTPCILHWDMNHFVVLQRATHRNVKIWDPAVGIRSLSQHETSRHFTGVALELTPNADFKPAPPSPRIPLRALTGQILGLKRSLLQILALAIVLELFALASPLLNQFVVDDAITTQDADLLAVLVMGFGLLLLAQTLVGLARSWMVMVLGQAVSVQWSCNLFAHLIQLPMPWFEKRHLGDIVSRFGAMGQIQQALTTQVIEAMLDGLMAIAALGMMLMYSPKLAAVVVVAVLAYGLLRLVAYRPFRAASAERLVLAAKESSHFLETLRAIAPLRLFGREAERRARWQNLLIEVENRDVRTAKLSIVFSTANTFIFGAENLLVFWWGAKLVMASTGAAPFTVGMLFAFIAYKGQFSGRMSALINHVLDLRMLGLHTERLSDIALTAPEDPGGIRNRQLDALPASVSLRNVRFRFASDSPWILNGIKLHIEPGEHIAIVGASGGGKTTLLKILLGLLEPTDGAIEFGGQPLKAVGLATARSWVGSVMQDDVLLSGSISENISFFDTQPNPERVRACAKLAGIAGEVQRMPMGFDTLVGDLGSSLSGGQKQRVLLARALYKQPRILVLDEATSHLDLARESAVNRTLAQLRVTRIVVAHRPQTIAAAGRVFALVRGQLRELSSVERQQTFSADDRIRTLSTVPTAA